MHKEETTPMEPVEVARLRRCSISRMPPRWVPGNSGARPGQDAEKGEGMIRKTDPTVFEATCDVCKKDLMCEDIAGQANYGLLRAEFGWGSRLDDDPFDLHLCEDCWEKALNFLGLKSPHDIPDQSPPSEGL